MHQWIMPYEYAYANYIGALTFNQMYKVICFFNIFSHAISVRMICALLLFDWKLFCMLQRLFAVQTLQNLKGSQPTEVYSVLRFDSTRLLYIRLINNCLISLFIISLQGAPGPIGLPGQIGPTGPKVGFIRIHLPNNMIVHKSFLVKNAVHT